MFKKRARLLDRAFSGVSFVVYRLCVYLVFLSQHDFFDFSEVLFSQCVRIWKLNSICVAMSSGDDFCRVLAPLILLELRASRSG